MRPDGRIKGCRCYIAPYSSFQYASLNLSPVWWWVGSTDLTDRFSAIPIEDTTKNHMALRGIFALMLYGLYNPLIYAVVRR